MALRLGNWFEVTTMSLVGMSARGEVDEGYNLVRLTLHRKCSSNGCRGNIETVNVNSQIPTASIEEVDGTSKQESNQNLNITETTNLLLKCHSKNEIWVFSSPEEGFFRS